MVAFNNKKKNEGREINSEEKRLSEKNNLWGKVIGS